MPTGREPPARGSDVLAARQLNRGRFQLLWRNTATGRHALWTLNAAGRRRISPIT